MEQPTPSKKKTQTRYLLGIAAILVAVYAVQTAGAPSYTLPLAEKRLHQLNDVFLKYAKISGQDAVMHYSNLALIGFGPSKKVTIDRWSVDIIRPSWLNMEKMTLSSENVEMLPNHTSPDSLLLEFPQTINIITGSELSYNITPDKPFYFLSDESEDGSNVTQKISLVKDASLQFHNKHAGYSVFMEDSLSGESSLNTKDESWMASLHTGAASLQKNDVTWKVENAAFRLSAAKKSPVEITSKGTLTLDNITLSEIVIDQPINFNIAWVYKETLNLAGAEDSSEITIERGMLTDDKVKIASSGTLHFSVEEKDPYGELVLEISDVKLLAASHWIKDSKRAEFKKLLEVMIGQKIEKRTQEIITIAREKNGEWKCGKITCQTLVEQGMLGMLIFNPEKHHDQENNSSENPS